MCVVQWYTITRGFPSIVTSHAERGDSVCIFGDRERGLKLKLDRSRLVFTGPKLRPQINLLNKDILYVKPQRKYLQKNSLRCHKNFEELSNFWEKLEKASKQRLLDLVSLIPGGFSTFPRSSCIFYGCRLRRRQ